MESVYKLLSWFFGVILLLSGVMALLTMPMVGAVYIVVSLFLLPPSRAFVYAKTNMKLTTKARAAFIVVLVLVSGVLVGVSERAAKDALIAEQQRERAAALAALDEKNKAYFKTNRAAVLALVNKHIKADDYQLASDTAAPYRVADDKELYRLYALAQRKLDEQTTAATIAALQKQVKKVVASDFAKNKELYGELASLAPDNKKYQAKVVYYTKKLKDKEKKDAVAAARAKRISDQFNPWDGSHYALERHIKKAMNDPSSYEHAETVYWDRGDHLVVKMVYRGKNAFGGIVRNFIKVKVSLDGVLLEVLDAT